MNESIFNHNIALPVLCHQRTVKKVLRSNFLPFFIRTSVVVSGLFYAVSSYANPSGGTLVGGQATIAGQGTAHVEIRQTTDRAAIDWKSFSIAEGERTSVYQPTSRSILLNRVTGHDPSRIMGQLDANGILILSNPNGVLIGKSGRVDAGGFVATTHSIDPQAFMAGEKILRFEGLDSESLQASVVNEGTLSIRDAGLAAFVAPSVANRGLIVARLGRVTLGAAKGFKLDLYGDNLVSFALSDRLEKNLVLADGSSFKARVENDGHIDAAGGRVVLTAAQAREVVNQAVNVGGSISANSISEKDGVIILSAHDGEGRASGSLTLGSTAILEAQGLNEGDKGGRIDLSAQRIVLEEKAQIKADGQAGGGRIQIGGGYQGKGDLLHADHVEQKKGSTVTANALKKGDGGEIVLWSDKSTRMDGFLSAKGGQEGGNGGRIETSSLGLLGLSGFADASARLGHNGSWLLDPSNVTIGATGTDIAASGGTINPSSDSFVISAFSISAALTNGNNVTITTTNAGGAQSGTITVNGSIAKTGGGQATLTLKADESIVFSSGASITSTMEKLNLILWSDSNANNSGSIRMTNSTIQSNGGNVVMSGGLDNGANGGIAGDGIPDGFVYGTSSAYNGIGISNTTIDVGTGSVLLRGKAIDKSTHGYLFGVSLSNGTKIRSTTGSLSITGVGNNGTDGNMGVYIGDSTTQISTVSGAIDVHGTSGYGTGVANFGLWIQNAQIVSTGEGESVGAITITGVAQGAPTASNGFGIGISKSALISAVDSNIVLHGTGAANTAGGAHGLKFYDTGSNLEIKGGGNLTMTGIGQGTSSSIMVSGGTLVQFGGAQARGDIIFNADLWAGSFNSVLTSGNIVIEPFTVGRSIGLAGASGSLSINTTNLAALHAGGKIIIGNADAGEIRANAMNWTSSVDLLSRSGVVFNGVQSMGNNRLFIRAYDGNVSFGVGAGAQSSAMDEAITLVAGGDFINQAGSSALSVSNGRWLIYTPSNSGNVYDGLNSANHAIWGIAASDAVAQTGNRYVFAERPLLTITTHDLYKTYGQDITAQLPLSYSIAGLRQGVAQAFLDDIYGSVTSGSFAIMSGGASASAQVLSSPYPMVINQGSLSATTGYDFSFVSAGSITVRPAQLLISAQDATKMQGDRNPSFTASYTGFVNGEGAGHLIQPPRFATPANNTPQAGVYSLIPWGAESHNYDITYRPASFTVTSLPIEVLSPVLSTVYKKDSPNSVTQPTEKSLVVTEPVWGQAPVNEGPTQTGMILDLPAGLFLCAPDENGRCLIADR